MLRNAGNFEINGSSQKFGEKQVWRFPFFTKVVLNSILLFTLFFFVLLQKRTKKKSRLFSFLNAKMKKADLNLSFDNYMMRCYILTFAIFEPSLVLPFS